MKIYMGIPNMEGWYRVVMPENTSKGGLKLIALDGELVERDEKSNTIKYGAVAFDKNEKLDLEDYIFADTDIRRMRPRNNDTYGVTVAEQIPGMSSRILRVKANERAPKYDPNSRPMNEWEIEELVSELRFENMHPVALVNFQTEHTSGKLQSLTAAVTYLTERNSEALK